MARGNNKRNVFHHPDDFTAFMDRLQLCINESLETHHFCLMTNHYHLLIKADTAETLSKFMHRLQRLYHHYYRRKHAYFGHLFQGRYKSIVINNESHLLDCGRYIERNPVRAGLVKHPKDWKYSSFRHYACRRSDKPIWLTYSPAFLGLSTDEEERMRLYEKHVAEERAYEAIVDKHLHKS